MSRFPLWLLTLVPTVGFAIPRYHAVDLGVLDIAGTYNRHVMSLANDGSVGLGGQSAENPAYLYHNGTLTPVAELTGGDNPGSIFNASTDVFSYQNVSMYHGEKRIVYGEDLFSAARVTKTTLNGNFCFYAYDSINLITSKGYYQRDGNWVRAYPAATAVEMTGVNRFGDVVFSAGFQRGFYQEGWVIPRGTTTPVKLDWVTTAESINDRGTILGTIGWDTPWLTGSHALQLVKTPDGKSRWDPNTMKLNNNDQVASVAVRNGKNEPYLWGNGQSWWLRDMLDNPQDVPQLTMPFVGLNDQGQMAATVRQDGKTRLFRFDPVPEPATYLALGLGFAAILRRRR